jgi:hypothetical protein
MNRYTRSGDYFPAFRIRIRSGLERVSGSFRQAKIVPEKIKKFMLNWRLPVLLELECPDTFVGI